MSDIAFAVMDRIRDRKALRRNIILFFGRPFKEKQNSKSEIPNSKQYQIPEYQMFQKVKSYFEFENFGHWDLFEISKSGFRI
jgi:hypothetical protein